jgi:phage replication O-like protein O
MANPQTQNGFTRLANEILEAMAKCNCFGFSNGQIIWVILRKTYGWNKKEDRISISQLQEATGLSRRTVIYSLQELEAKKIIFIIRERKGSLNAVNLIKFNKDYETWVVQNSSPQTINNRIRAKVNSAKLRQADRGSLKLGKGVVQNPVLEVNSFAPTKETTTKDINTNTSQPTVAGLISKDFIHTLKARSSKASPNSSSGLLAAEIYEWSGKKLKFPMLMRLIKLKGERFIRMAWAEVKDSKAKEPYKLLMWKIKQTKVEIK